LDSYHYIGRRIESDNRFLILMDRKGERPPED